MCFPWESSRSFKMTLYYWYVVATSVASGAAVFQFAHGGVMASIAIALSVAIVLVVVGQLVAAIKQRIAAGSLSVFRGVYEYIRSNPVRLGAHMAHFGVAIMAISIVSSYGFKIEEDLVLYPSQPVEFAGYSLQLQGVEEIKGSNFEGVKAVIEVSDGGETVTTLHPQKRAYLGREETTTEVDMQITPLRDLYLALTAVEADRSVIIKAYLNPLQVWLWVGSLVLLLGSTIVFIARKRTLV